MSDAEALLRRFSPELRYDSNEAFFADSAQEWTNNPFNELRRGPVDDRPGELLASAAGVPRLSLDHLGWPAYADGTTASEDDLIAVARRRDYRDMYVKLRGDVTYRDRIYGRLVTDPTDHRDWLQYWFFYFYNDYQLAGNFGLHEGDWEMVQFRLDGEVPDLAVYAQHRQAQVDGWEEIERDGDIPVVYVARGSHASYFAAGYHETEAWYDIADGRGRRVRPQLEIVSSDPPGWLLWRGRWGGTRARIADLEQPSPQAPCCHPQWDNPGLLLADPREVVTRPPPGAPTATVKRRPRGIALTFSMPTNALAAVESIILTLRSDDQLENRTFTYGGYTVREGSLQTNIALKPQQRYDAFLSTTDVNGHPSSSCHVPLPAPHEQPVKERLLKQMAEASRTVSEFLRPLRRSGREQRAENSDAR